MAGEEYVSYTGAQPRFGRKTGDRQDIFGTEDNIADNKAIWTAFLPTGRKRNLAPCPLK